jgi:hypothetical protein
MFAHVLARNCLDSSQMDLHDSLAYLPNNARSGKLALHANTIAELRLGGASFGMIVE